MTSLGELLTMERRSVQPDEIVVGENYLGLEDIETGGSILRVKRVNEGQVQSAKFLFDSRHVLFGKLRPNLGKVARPAFSGIYSTDILPLLPGPSLDRDYLAHYLLSPPVVAWSASRTSGANLPRLSPSVLETLEIPLPPLPEQRRIASILDQADNLRALRRNSLEVLKTIAVSHYESVELHSYDWTEVALSDVVAPGDRINYGVVQPGEEDRNGTPLIRVGDLRNGVVDRSKLRRISSEVESGYSRSRISGNEVLVSCVGSIGEVAIIGPQDVGSNVARAVARVPVRVDVERSYVAAVLRSARVQSYFHSELRTVSQPTLNIKQLALTRISLPPKEIQDKFRRVSASLETLVKSSRLHLAKVDELFASLQYRAFRGEL